jgi:hypothetical protein
MYKTGQITYTQLYALFLRGEITAEELSRSQAVTVNIFIVTFPCNGTTWKEKESKCHIVMQNEGIRRF